MSRYNQYGNNNYSDPVGSQSTQPTGYSYQATASTPTYQNAPNSSTYGASGYQGYGSGSGSYNNQQYGSSAPQTNNSASNAAAALSSLSGTQSYGQTSSTSTANNNTRYSNAPSTNYNNTHSRNETQSPLYPSTQSSSTFGRMSVPEQSQSSSTTFGATQPAYSNAPSNASARSSSYQTAYTQPQSQPPRYNSPLHAVQAQQSHRHQVSQSSNHIPSPQMANATQQPNRQSSASVEPSATTVDPSQVYDNRAELQRKAQIDAEKRRKYEAQQAAKKVKQERLAEEARKREEAEKQRKAEDDAAKKVEEQKRKDEQIKKAREDKKQSKNAATALQRLSSGTTDAPGPSGGNDEEAEMRAMFQKMREFNSKNPAMLAKLWEEERTSHEATKGSPTPAPVALVAKAGTASSPTKAATKPTQLVPPPVMKVVNSTAKVPTPQPPRPTPAAATTTSLWPPHKKGALAEVTAKWLVSLPTNAGKVIQPEVVRNILDTNPAYVQLCESLESIGMQFDRSTLARELLKAVPDGLKTQTVPAVPAQRSGSLQANGAMPASPDSQRKGKQRASDRPGSASSAAVKTVEYEAPSSLAQVAREVNSMHKASFQPINAQQNQTLQMQQSIYFSQPFSPVNRAAPSLPNASRASSSVAEVKPIIKPEEPRRPPADKEEAARKRTFGDLVDLTMQDDSDEEGPPPKKMMAKPSDTQLVNGTNPQQRDPLFYLAKPTSFKQFMMPNMNQSGQGAVSLQTQQRQQANGYHQSFLSSQRPVLPSQPAPAAPKVKGPTPAQLQQSRMKGKLLVEPIMRDRAARKTTYDSRTIARDILLATGRHPDMRGLNAHLAVMQKLLGQHGLDSDGGNRSDLATIRWDVIDPEPVKKPAKDDTEAKKDENLTNDAPNTQPRPQQSSPKLLPLKKRGRPRMSDLPPDQLTNPALGTPAANASKTHYSRPSTPNPATPTSVPDMSTTASAGTVGYSSFGQVGEDGKKKKGRPFGWRAAVHSRAAQGLTPAIKPPKKVGRPPTVKPAQEPVGPEYQVYRCEWEGCKSELHNAETLKKHLVKVHGKSDARGGGYCKWEGCEEQEKQWGSMEEWLKHVDSVHLARIRWKLGDGPREVGELYALD